MATKIDKLFALKADVALAVLLSGRYAPAAVVATKGVRASTYAEVFHTAPIGGVVLSSIPWLCIVRYFVMFISRLAEHTLNKMVVALGLLFANGLIFALAYH